MTVSTLAGQTRDSSPLRRVGHSRIRRSPMQEFRLTPAGTPRANEQEEGQGIHADLLGLDLGDPLHQWWDAIAPQEGQLRTSTPQPLESPTILAPGRGTQQLTTGEGALVRPASTPPGIELTMATATGNLAGRRPQGPSQAARQPAGGDGQSGDACRVPATAPESVLPGITAVSLMNSPAFASEVHQGGQTQRDSDIFSFLAGERPRMPAEQGVPAGGPLGLWGVDMAAPAMLSSSAPGRGAAPVPPEIGLLRAAENGLQTTQTGTAMPSASAVAPSMAELNMVLKTLQTLVPDFPRLESGDPGTRARRLQQWLLHVTQASVPAGPHVTSWLRWVRTSADSTTGSF